MSKTDAAAMETNEENSVRAIDFSKSSVRKIFAKRRRRMPLR